MSERIEPSVSVAVKLASLAVHAQEMLSSGGHHFDQVAIEGLLSDPEIVAYLALLRGMALLPVVRDDC